MSTEHVCIFVNEFVRSYVMVVKDQDENNFSLGFEYSFVGCGHVKLRGNARIPYLYSS